MGYHTAPDPKAGHMNPPPLNLGAGFWIVILSNLRCSNIRHKVIKRMVLGETLNIISCWYHTEASFYRMLWYRKYKILGCSTE